MKTLALALTLATTALAAEPQFSDVFTGGQDGYPVYRIPSVVCSKKGTLLAFAEARQKLIDQAENDIVLKRSTDGGATWGALQVVHEDGANSLNNPTALVAESGRIFLMYQRIPAHLTEHSKDKIATGYEGPDVYRTLLVTSDDDGATWSAPREVTRGTKRPERANTIASGPGLGIQLTRGPHRGRLIIPFNEGPYGRWQNYAALSDDGGETWRCGADVPGAFLGEKSQINEVQMVELSDGSVRLASRQFAGAKVRRTAVSRDGGETWSAVAELPELTDPSCMAGLLRYSFDDAGGQGRLLHTGPDSTKRERGTIWLSTDDGATWPVKRLLWPGFFAYSVPVRLTDGTIGVLFEADGYKTIKFARVPLAWIAGP
jgi:sialidase-1